MDAALEPARYAQNNAQSALALVSKVRADQVSPDSSSPAVLKEEITPGAEGPGELGV